MLREYIRDRINALEYNECPHSLESGTCDLMCLSCTVRDVITAVADDIEMNHDQDEYRFIVKCLRGLLDN